MKEFIDKSNFIFKRSTRRKMRKKTKINKLVM
jgi:hypothetical protein